MKGFFVIAFLNQVVSVDPDSYPKRKSKQAKQKLRLVLLKALPHLCKVKSVYCRLHCPFLRAIKLSSNSASSLSVGSFRIAIAKTDMELRREGSRFCSEFYDAKWLCINVKLSKRHFHESE